MLLFLVTGDVTVLYSEAAHGAYHVDPSAVKSLPRWRLLVSTTLSILTDVKKIKN